MFSNLNHHCKQFAQIFQNKYTHQSSHQMQEEIKSCLSYPNTKLSDFGKIYCFCFLGGTQTLMGWNDPISLRKIVSKMLKCSNEIEHWLAQKQSFFSILTTSPYKLMVTKSDEKKHAKLFQQKPFRPMLTPTELLLCYKHFHLKPPTKPLILCSLWYTMCLDTAPFNTQTWGRNYPYVDNIEKFLKRTFSVLKTNPWKRNAYGKSYDGFHSPNVTFHQLKEVFKHQFLTNTYIPLSISTISLGGKFQRLLQIKEWKQMVDFILKEVKRYLNTSSILQPWIKEEHFEGLSPDQQNALKQIVNGSNFIAVGGAGGTGKSELCSRIQRAAPSVKMLFLTPSGKAAENLKKRNLKAQTYHRQLVLSYHTETVLPSGGILVLDEASMINLWDLYFILKFAQDSGIQQVILLGDPYQLPPVQNCGTLFHTLFKIKASCTVMLTTNHRSSDYADLFELGSSLRQVMDRKKPLTPEIFQNLPNVSFTLWTEEDQMETLLHQCLNSIEKMDSNQFHQHTRIITMRRTGMILYQKKQINTLTKATIQLLTRFNPNRSSSNTMFYPGDLCMSTKNIVLKNELAVANGTEGLILSTHYRQFPSSYRLEALQVQLNHQTFDYNRQQKGEKSDKIQRMMETLEHGAFTTTHKFQGSEQDHIIAIGSLKGLRGYSLELFYTQCSRPRKSLFILLHQKVFDLLRSNPHKPYYNPLFQKRLERAL